MDFLGNQTRINFLGNQTRMNFLGNQTRMNFPGNRMGDGFSRKLNGGWIFLGIKQGLQKKKSNK